MLRLLKILRYTHVAVSWCKLLPTALLLLLLLLLSLRSLHDECDFFPSFLWLEDPPPVRSK